MIYEPTRQLRFVRRNVVGEIGQLILQQRFVVKGQYGATSYEWRDVPVEEEEQKT
jgi:hypothetical protein